jgi:hypothetical protein
MKGVKGHRGAKTSSFCRHISMVSLEVALVDFLARTIGDSGTKGVGCRWKGAWCDIQRA